MYIVCIIILLISLFLFFKTYQRNQSLKEIQSKNDLAKKELKQTNEKIQQKQEYLLELKNKEIKIKKELDDGFSEKKQALDLYYENLKQSSKNSFSLYKKDLDEQYLKVEQRYKDQIDKVLKEKTLVQQDLDQLKAVYKAATAARIKEQQEQEKLAFYCLKITDKQISDIQRLQQWKHELYDPSIVAKIIWSSYIMKATTELCNRVVGTKQTCGIYKITNLKTKQVYIGQSVNISDRFKNHIRCGLGIDASPTNKLYNNMQETGVWNFTFEVLQTCTRDKLNEKERFWIEMYQSDKIGMNLTKGNK